MRERQIGKEKNTRKEEMREIEKGGIKERKSIIIRQKERMKHKMREKIQKKVKKKKIDKKQEKD